jgi:hypothetical protein
MTLDNRANDVEEDSRDWWDGPERAGAAELVATVVLTVAIQPFVQAVAAKAGEDVWPWLKGLARGGRRCEEPEARVLDIQCDAERLVVRMPRKLRQEALHTMADELRELPPDPGWRRLAYDPATRTWELSTIDPPAQGPQD